MNQDLQQENRVRMERAREHKRGQVLALQQAVRERNFRKTDSFRTFDSNFRKQVVLNQKAKERTLNEFAKLVKGYPYQADERKKMAATLRALNGKLGLGLTLEFPARGIVRKGSATAIEASQS